MCSPSSCLSVLSVRPRSVLHPPVGAAADPVGWQGRAAQSPVWATPGARWLAWAPLAVHVAAGLRVLPLAAALRIPGAGPRSRWVDALPSAAALWLSGDRRPSPSQSPHHSHSGHLVALVQTSMLRCCWSCSPPLMPAGLQDVRHCSQAGTAEALQMGSPADLYAPRQHLRLQLQPAAAPADLCDSCLHM